MTDSQKTWTIVGLLALLAVVVLAVPTLRENLASWLVWLGMALGAAAAESERRAGEKDTTVPPPTETHEAAELDEEVGQAAEDEAQPTDEELVEDFEELAQ